MTGPLAQQIAQADDALNVIARLHPDAAPLVGPASEIRNVLSVIERHVQEMERAVWAAFGRTSEPGVRDLLRPALPAREEGAPTNE